MSVWDEVAGVVTGLVTTAATGGNVAAGAAAGTAARNAAQGLQGKKLGPGVPCPGQPSRDAVIHILESCTPEERQRWASAWIVANKELPFESMVAQDLFSLARNSLGGDDCKASSAQGKALITVFNELVNKYGSTAPRSGDGGTGWSAAPPAPASGSGIGTGPTSAPSAWEAEKGGTGSDIDVRGCVRVGNTLVCGDTNAGNNNNMLLYAGGALLVFLLMSRGGK